MRFAVLVLLAACHTAEGPPPEAPPGASPVIDTAAGTPTDTGIATTTPSTGTVGSTPSCPAVPGTICPWAGSGYRGFRNGVDVLDAFLASPRDVALSPDAVPAVADHDNHMIRVIDGMTAAGTGSFRTLADRAVNDGPAQAEWGADGLLWVAGHRNHAVYALDPATGAVSVALGSAAGYAPDDSASYGSAFDATNARLLAPRSLARTAAGEVIVCDSGNQRIRLWDPGAGTIRTLAGTGVLGATGTNGPALLADLGLTPDPVWGEGGAIALSADEQRVYVAETANHCIRSVDLASGLLEHVAGACGEAGDALGSSIDARFRDPMDLALDAATNQLFVADTDNHAIKVVDLATGQVDRVVGTGAPTCLSPYGVEVPELCDAIHTAGDGGPSLDATLYRPFGVALDDDGNLVIADTFDQRFRIAYRAR